MDKWDGLENPLTSSTLKTLKRLNFTRMTPVQASVIPLFMQRKGNRISFLFNVLSFLPTIEYFKQINFLNNHTLRL